MTDEWMVLGVVYCARHDVPRFPIVENILEQYLDSLTWGDIFDLSDFVPEDLPNLDKILKKRKGYYGKHYRWIHRQLAKIESRQPVLNAAVRKDFEGNTPTLETCSGVYQVVDGKMISTDGELIRMEDNHVCLVNTQWDFEDLGNPTWSQVPILGYLFVKEKTTKREVIAKLPLESIFFISQHVPYDYWKNRRREVKQMAN